MKVRLLEKELEKSGYRFIRYAKGSHCIYEHPLTLHTVSVSGKEGK